MGGLNGDLVVLMLPFPAQGHLSPLLHFSRLLALKGLRVIFLGSMTHNRQARLRLQGWDLSSFPAISFQDLPLPSFPVPDPDPESTTKFPEHLIPAFEVSGQLRDPLDLLLRSLSASCRRVVIVHDPLMSFAEDLGSNYPNVEAFAYRCVSVFSSLSFQMHQEEEIKRIKPNLDPVSPQDCFSSEFTDFMKRRHRHTALSKGEFFNTFDAIEGEFIDMLSKRPQYQNKRIWAIGPVIPLQPTKSSDPKPSSVFDWLDKQPAASVLYISFGSITSLSSSQITQLATGLERSGQRFLWVLRAADRGDIFKGRRNQIQLPEGFEKRLAGLGQVFREWAPQLNILSHAAVGGFLTHCGWNSCMEGLSLGVPMATWPLHSDQPANAQLVTQVLKVGVVVREWGSTSGVVPAEKIEKAVRRLMEDSPERAEIRKRSAKLRDAAWHASSRAGSSDAALDSFGNDFEENELR